MQCFGSSQFSAGYHLLHPRLVMYDLSGFSRPLRRPASPRSDFPFCWGLISWGFDATNKMPGGLTLHSLLLECPLHPFGVREGSIIYLSICFVCKYDEWYLLFACVVDVYHWHWHWPFAWFNYLLINLFKWSLKWKNDWLTVWLIIWLVISLICLIEFGPILCGRKKCCWFSEVEEIMMTTI